MSEPTVDRGLEAVGAIYRSVPYVTVTGAKAGARKTCA
jgi:hypothetical protein